jgi:Uma2 family endonuclease
MANRQLYERSGIPEYWIVDLEDHTALQWGISERIPFRQAGKKLAR